MQHSAPCYGRCHCEFPLDSGVDTVRFIGPDGACHLRVAFRHQPATLEYDRHGYETVSLAGDRVRAVRFTPTVVGHYRYEALREGRVVDQGVLECTPSDHPGYVQVSERDPRYFACSDGSAFVPLGLNLVRPCSYPLPAGMEHFATSNEQATMGCADYARWFRLLHENGANYVRIWLSSAYFEVETDVAGELVLRQFTKVDRLVELARQYEIRLKLCFEHWRTFKPGTVFARTLRHPEDGREPESVDAWLQDQVWRELWLLKVEAYMARYGDDPTVMAWELWNEIDCMATSDWSVQRDWTRHMLPILQEMVPAQMVVNSLGSLDNERKQAVYDSLAAEDIAFQQVHRYLDQGAPLGICRTDPVAGGVDAIRANLCDHKPVMLAETGGVNDRHTGPFRYYRWDNDGLIMHDCTYPTLFAGAAGSGQIWHWDHYVDEKDQWCQFKPLAELIEGVSVDREGFQPFDVSTESAWVLGLAGREHILVWLRNKADRWDLVLRDGLMPAPIIGMSLDLSAFGEVASVETIWPWADGAPGVAATCREGVINLPSFAKAVLLRITKKTTKESCL